MWRIIQESPETLTESEINDFLRAYMYMPYKGCGGIHVETEIDKIKAIELLKDYCSNDSYFEDELLESFISSHGVPETFCYGKFKIDKPIEFFEILLNNKVKIVNVAFFEYTDIYQ